MTSTLRRIRSSIRARSGGSGTARSAAGDDAVSLRAAVEEVRAALGAMDVGIHDQLREIREELHRELSAVRAENDALYRRIDELSDGPTRSITSSSSDS